jgi:hypothetical protein
MPITSCLLSGMMKPADGAQTWLVTAEGEIAALVHVAAGDQPQIDLAQHLDQPRAHRLRDVADRGRRQFGIVGAFRTAACAGTAPPACRGGCELRGEPVDLLGLEGKPGVHHQRIQPDEAPAGGLEAPAVLAEHREKPPAVAFGDRLRRWRADRGRVVADVVIAGQIAAGHRQRACSFGKFEIVADWSGHRRRRRRC